MVDSKCGGGRVSFGADGMKLEESLEAGHGEVIVKTTATVKVGYGEQPWYVVRLRK